MIIEAIKTSFKVLTTNKLRTILTMLGIVIGIFSISMIFSISNGTRKFMYEEFQKFQVDSISAYIHEISDIERKELEREMGKLVKEEPKIIAMSKYTSFYFKEYDYALSVYYYDRDGYPSGYNYAIDENYMNIYKENMETIVIKDGRFLTEKDISSNMPYIVIREDVAEKLLGTNKDIIGKKITVNNYEYEIIGVTKWGEDYDVPNVVIPYSNFSPEFRTSDPSYEFKIDDASNVKEIEGKLNKLFGSYINPECYNVGSMDNSDILKESESMINLIELVFVGIAGLSILVGGIGIMNIMLVSVSERIKETGVRIALGARNIDIIIQFLIEGIMITLFSGIIGLALAYITTIIGNSFLVDLGDEFMIRLLIDFKTCIYIVIFCGVLGIVFGIYPAIKAGKLDPVEALKYE